MFKQHFRSEPSQSSIAEIPPGCPDNVKQRRKEEARKKPD